jgi:hypothetical protein
VKGSPGGEATLGRRGEVRRCDPEVRHCDPTLGEGAGCRLRRAAGRLRLRPSGLVSKAEDLEAAGFALPHSAACNPQQAKSETDADPQETTAKSGAGGSRQTAGPRAVTRG